MTRSHDMIIKLRRKLNHFQRDVRWRSGFGRQGFNSTRRGRILVYHGICLSDHHRYNTLFLTLKTFEKQIQLYKKHFNIISLNDFYEERFSKNKFSVCLTFDDGFANNYKYVLPLLEKNQVPASFFVTSIRNTGYDFLWNDMLSIAHRHGPSKFNFRNEEFIKSPDGSYLSSTTKMFLSDMLRHESFESKASLIDVLGSFFSLKEKAHEDYWLQMSKEQIRSLAASKWVTIGSHSYYHNDLAKIPVSDLKADVEGSKQYLENIIQK
ncbi:MAG TPA: polysaccharide deacetylase family protein, partial [Chitinophagaceae bacterium]|nr:polysaccharide deacetylase family protein [Chitinophagaceae bacterium]